MSYHFNEAQDDIPALPDITRGMRRRRASMDHFIFVISTKRRTVDRLCLTEQEVSEGEDQAWIFYPCNFNEAQEGRPALPDITRGMRRRRASMDHFILVISTKRRMIYRLCLT
jgi:hypothetical protein